MQAIFALVILFVLAFCGATIYKKRKAIQDWLNNPEEAPEWRRKTILRRRIEDAQTELEELEAKEREGK